ncbi:hypothetical protein ACIP4S_32590 [Streptomyces chartreusis]|uniref:hypothetical protein n=1 Tax=Streptomyces chartreusis TaxID=1969 RepID=UPI003826C7AF
MSGRRVTVLVTSGVVAVLAALFAVLRWDDADKIASAVSALAGVAAVGIGVWAGLTPHGTDQPEPRAAVLRVSGTGRATAGPSGRANTGVVASGGSLPSEVRVENTGDADASGGGEADSGIRLD